MIKPSELARKKLAAQMSKTAGEVRFIKDRGSDSKEWAWQMGPSERMIDPDYHFHSKNIKPLATTLRATVAALGHAMSAYSTFTKIKSATISPDGNLGGKGYIQKIGDMRRQYMNCVEALSALSDTLYDELNAAHWQGKTDGREREEIKEIMGDVEDIKEDPEGWAKKEEEEI